MKRSAFLCVLVLITLAFELVVALQRQGFDSRRYYGDMTVVDLVETAMRKQPRETLNILKKFVDLLPDESERIAYMREFQDAVVMEGTETTHHRGICIVCKVGWDSSV